MDIPPTSDRQPVPEEGHLEEAETHEEPKEEFTSVQDSSSKPEDIPIVTDASGDIPLSCPFSQLWPPQTRYLCPTLRRIQP